MTVKALRSNWPWLLLIALFAVLFYAPVLFQQKTQIHAEGVSLGVALMHMLSSALDGQHSMLWTTSIYGGHPIFAEGQGGFANPIHLLLAWLLPAVPAYNINQFLSMLLGGLGANAMCRECQCGRAASAFGALALAFSSLWIGGVNNLAVGSTMAWAPWAIWAMLRWLKQADFSSACYFGLVIAMMVLSGYPQLLHGTLIYLVVYLLTQLLSRRGRAVLTERRKALVASLLLAIVFSVTLSAVQWLPLLELARESHRSEGIAIIPQDRSTTVAFLRGFLYTFANPENYPDISAGSGSVYFTGVGSLLVCVVASTLVFFRLSPGVRGHVFATALLLILGFGMEGTPLFRIIYELHLVPGLHSFRVSFTYLFIAITGFTLLAAVALERLSQLGAAASTIRLRLSQLSVGRKVIATAWIILWLVAGWALHVEGVFTGQYVIAGLWVVLTVIALMLGSPVYIPVIALVLLCLDIALYRIDAYVFGDAELISKPGSIVALEVDGILDDYKFMDRTYAATYSLLHPQSPEVVLGLEKMLSSVTPAANALWGVSSLSGNLALGLQRRTLADALIDEELSPGSTKNPGYRLIDFGSVRYLAVGQHFDLPGFEDAYSDPTLPVRIVENSQARPRFQFFHNARTVQSVAEAIRAVSELAENELIIEATSGAPLPAGTDAAGTPSWLLLKDSPGHYQLNTQAENPFWLFLSDANYPGWTAYIDGEQTPLYSAQVLGKAVWVPAGSRTVDIAFEPLSVRLGLVLSILSASVMVLGLFWQRSRRKSISRRGD